MSFLETSHVEEGPFGGPDPLQLLVEYFRVNGYEPVEETAGQRPSTLTWTDRTTDTAPEDQAATESDQGAPQAAVDVPEEILLKVRMRRGQKGASYWTSNMAELLSDIEFKLIGNTVRLAYKVETTLQHLTDDDQRFWAHEAKQAMRVVKGEAKPVDWRENESIRVERQQKDILMVGVQLAFVAAVLVAIGYFAFTGG